MRSAADEFEAKGIEQKVMAARIRDDVILGRPVTRAVMLTGKLTRARRARKRGAQRQRDGLTR